MDIWKGNIMEELESGEIEYELAEEFLISLKKEFGEDYRSQTLSSTVLMENPSWDSSFPSSLGC